MHFLSNRGKLSFAHRIDWCLSSAANQACADAIFVRQGMFDRSAVFESCKGHHLMTMHQLLGASNIITWRSRTYRCVPAEAWTVNVFILVVQLVLRVLTCLPCSVLLYSCLSCLDAKP